MEGVSTPKATCETWSRRYRRCLFAARTQKDLYVCENIRQVEQGVEMGGPSCDVVLEHVLSLAPKVLTDDPKAVAKVREGYRDGCIAMSKQLKECALRTTALEQVPACSPQSLWNGGNRHDVIGSDGSTK
jgi:hypothetical protein